MQQTQLDLKAILEQMSRQRASLQIQIVRTKQLAAAARAELELSRESRTPAFPIEFMSQFGEDLLIWELLGHQPRGFFIEAGAFDGYHFSITYALEAIGWTGLLVEALPEPMERCRSRRPGSRVIGAALSRPGAPSSAAFAVIEDHYGGMFSYLKDTEQQLQDTSWAKRHTINVPVTTLDSLLVGHTGPIDAAVIDVEGGELDLLDGFDLNRFRPRILIIEDNSMGRDPALTNYMSGFPYQLALRLSVNAVFVRNDEAEVLQRAKWMQIG